MCLCFETGSPSVVQTGLEFVTTPPPAFSAETKGMYYHAWQEQELPSLHFKIEELGAKAEKLYSETADTDL